MKEILENKIGEMLRSYTEQPSENCWNIISNSLPPIIPAYTPQNPFKQFIGSTVGKITTAIVTIATIATATILIVNPQNELNTPNNNSLLDYQIANSDTTESVADMPIAKPIEKKINPISQPISQAPILSKTAIEPLEEAYKSSKIANEGCKLHLISPNTKPKATNQPAPTDIKTETKTFDEEIYDTTSEYTETNTLITTNKVENITETPFIDFEELKRPNVFTPNGDGVNDFLMFKNIEKFSKNRLIVVNVNGVKVYERNNYDNSWDASNTPDGTYFYILELFNGKENVTISGTLHILR